MTKIIYLIAGISLLISCANNPKNGSNEETYQNNKWGERTVELTDFDSLVTGKTYLSIYSQIYSISEHKTHNLTAMVSIRNTSETDTIYLNKAKYFDTKGSLVKNYIEHSIYISPLETIEIIIGEKETEGGTGSNFIFDWQTKTNTSEPLFEAVMNSTIGQQGLSFTTQGKRLQ